MVKYDDYFIKLPNNIVWTYVEGETSMINGVNNKVTMVLSNLMFRRDAIGTCYFTLENLITKCGYAPKTGKGKMNEQFKDILIQLQQLGFIINSNIDMKDIKPSSFIECNINPNIPQGEDGKDIMFFRLFYKDYMKIINLDTVKDKDLILNTYCYINSRIKHRPDDYRSESEYTWRNEGKAEYTHFTYFDAVKDLNMTETTFKENIDILAENGLIAYGNIGLVNKDGNTRMANNVYVIDLEEFKPAMSDSKYYYESSGYSIIGKKSSKITKSIIGLNSRIIQLNEQGYNTHKMKAKLKKLENEKEKKKTDSDKVRKKFIS